VFVTDITGRKQTEAALRESEERFRLLADSSPVLIWVNDMAGAQFVNRAYLDFLGVGEVDVQRYDWAQFIHPDDREAYVTAYLDAFNRRDLFEAQFRFRRADGEYRWMKSVGTPRMTPTGEFLGYVGSTLDITDIKQAEHSLRANEQEFRAIFELAGSANVVVDPATSRFLRVNRRYCELTGYTEDELLAMTAPEVTHPEDRAQEQALVWPVRQGQQDHWQIEKRYLRKDGQVVWGLVTGRLTRDEQGQPLHTIATVQDITARKQMEEVLRRAHDQLEQQVADRTAELERSLQELHQFTYIASHDLKTPLRGMRHLVDWIGEDAGDVLPETSKTYLDRLAGRIERLEKFLNDLLLYSRLDHDYYQETELIETGSLVKGIIDLLEPPPGFTITLQEPLPSLTTRWTPLELVFRNLIENAIKHHHRGDGRIEISARESADFVEFTVADDGPGIDPVFHERIFQIFQTLQPRDQVEGSGAGLAIAKKAVERHGGTLAVSSVPGDGATFRFTWPKHSDKLPVVGQA
jgi:PAS domain S-box-containing protein